VSGAAFAQSNVEIYGTLDIGYLKANLDNSTRAAVTGAKTRTNTDVQSTGMQDGPLSTNHIGFRGSEDLGNGLKATFQIEMGMNEQNRIGADTGGETDFLGAFAFRKQNIGLSGGFGSVTFGRQSILIDDAWAVGSAGMKNGAYGDMYTSASASGNIGNFLALNGQFHDVRANEVITYVSPNFSGFTASVQYGTGNTDANASGGAVVGDSNADHTNWGLRADYANGPLALVAAYNSEKNDGTSIAAATNVVGIVAGVPAVIATPVSYAGSNTDRDSWLLGANYNFGIVKVFGQYFDGSRNVNTYTGAVATGRVVAEADADISGWELGVHVPVTAQITLAGTYFDTSYDWKNTAAGVLVSKGDGGGNGYQLAALYSLSKRTTAYAMYGNEKTTLDTDNSLAKTSADIWNVAAGIKHTF
jgi:predicted porin